MWNAIKEIYILIRVSSPSGPNVVPGCLRDVNGEINSHGDLQALVCWCLLQNIMGQICSCSGSRPQRSETFLLPYLNNSINVSLISKVVLTRIP